MDNKSSVAVWGAGPVGSMAAYLARNIRGAPHVVSIDHNPFRLDKAAKNGCDPLNFDGVDVVKELKKRMPAGRPSRCIGQQGGGEGHCRSSA